MTETWQCAQARPALGVYVLEAIDPGDRRLASAHLTTCKDCAAELAGLAGLPALLAGVHPDDVDRVCAAVDQDRAGDAPGAWLGPGRRGRHRNTWRWMLIAAAAAAVVVGVGLFTGSWTVTSTTLTVPVPVSAGTATWQTAHGASQVTGATATVAYAAQMWGDAFEVLVTHIPAGTTCELWAVHPDGTQTEVAAWTTAHDEGRVWYPGSMPRTAGQITRFEIRTGTKLLVEVTPI